MAALGRQWQFADGADAWVWLARALAAKLMFPAPPHGHAHCQSATFAVLIWPLVTGHSCSYVVFKLKPTRARIFSLAEMRFDFSCQQR